MMRRPPSRSPSRGCDDWPRSSCHAVARCKYSFYRGLCAIFFLCGRGPLLAAADSLYRDCLPGDKDAGGMCAVTELEHPAEKVAELAKRDELWIINYYAGWCPHCQTFVPTYKEIAAKFRSQIHFAAVNCEVHFVFCAKIGVHSYPTLRAYHEDPSDASEHGDDAILKLSKEDQHGPDRVETYSTLINRFLSKAVGKRGGTAGTAITTSMPSALEATPAQEVPLSKASAEVKPPDWRWSTVEGESGVATASAHATYADRENDAAVAILHTLQTGTYLRAEEGALPLKVWTELKDWLSLLVEYFPRNALANDLDVLLKRLPDEPLTAPNWEQTLETWAAEESRQDALVRQVIVPSEDIKKEGTSSSAGSSSVVSSGGSSSTAGSAGAGGDVLPLKSVRSYSSALWQLMQILCVVVDRHFAPVPAGPGMALRGGFPVGKRLFYDRLRAFIDNFFGCDDCRRKFLDRFDRCAFGRCDASQAASLWLWELHNRVTQRVARERRAEAEAQASGNSPHEHHSEDLTVGNLDVKLLYPSPETCPRCYSAELLSGVVANRARSEAEKSQWASLAKGVSQRLAATGDAERWRPPSATSTHDLDDESHLKPSGSAMFNQIFNAGAVEHFLLRVYDMHADHDEATAKKLDEELGIVPSTAPKQTSASNADDSAALAGGYGGEAGASSSTGEQAGEAAISSGWTLGLIPLSPSTSMLLLVWAAACFLMYMYSPNCRRRVQFYGRVLSRFVWRSGGSRSYGNMRNNTNNNYNFNSMDAGDGFRELTEMSGRGMGGVNKPLGAVHFVGDDIL
ncbi:unnamed protein product [Amoebophrya sp. A25]|nr:unnamed protein product [Amoebophrya sp. A25]|eukprot:GSA25T00025303001.1